MIRGAIVAFVVGVSVNPGCAAQQAGAGTTTTTSGVLGRPAPACAEIESACVQDVDCCGVWCVAGVCKAREP
jgi:hypothetical protein